MDWLLTLCSYAHHFAITHACPAFVSFSELQRKRCRSASQSHGTVAVSPSSVVWPLIPNCWRISSTYIVFFESSWRSFRWSDRCTGNRLSLRLKRWRITPPPHITWAHIQPSFNGGGIRKLHLLWYEVAQIGLQLQCICWKSFRFHNPRIVFGSPHRKPKSQSCSKLILMHNIISTSSCNSTYLSRGRLVPTLILTTSHPIKLFKIDENIKIYFIKV